MSSCTGNTIRELRLQAGFTQKGLAEALHVTDKAVSKWERGLCLPDTDLLPRLSLLLDTDIEAIISKEIENEEWIGLIDIKGCDFSQPVYDKPLVDYMLIHYLLLGITKIHIISSKQNQEYLKRNCYSELGFNFDFEKPQENNLVILDHPWFLFGSDLTQQFQGAMLSNRTTKLVPENQKPTFYITREGGLYFTDKRELFKRSIKRTLGRGMVCLDMSNNDRLLEAAAFVKTYQNNSGLLIGSLEEVADKKVNRRSIGRG